MVLEKKWGRWGPINYGISSFGFPNRLVLILISPPKPAHSSFLTGSRLSCPKFFTITKKKKWPLQHWSVIATPLIVPQLPRPTAAHKSIRIQRVDAGQSLEVGERVETRGEKKRKTALSSTHNEESCRNSTPSSQKMPIILRDDGGWLNELVSGHWAVRDHVPVKGNVVFVTAARTDVSLIKNCAPHWSLWWWSWSGSCHTSGTWTSKGPNVWS